MGAQGRLAARRRGGRGRCDAGRVAGVGGCVARVGGRFALAAGGPHRRLRAWGQRGRFGSRRDGVGRNGGRLDRGGGRPGGKGREVGRRTRGHEALEALDALQERSPAVIDLRGGQPHERYFQGHAGVDRVVHIDNGLADHFHRPHQGRVAEPAGLGGRLIGGIVGHQHQRPSVDSEEAVAQVLDQIDSNAARISAGGDRRRHLEEHLGRVMVGDGVDQIGENGALVIDGPGGSHLIEGGQCVPRRAVTPADHEVDGLRRDTERSLGVDIPKKGRQHIRSQQVELEMLGAATDGREHFLRVRGGEHEDHVGGGLLQRLEEGAGRGRGHLMNLVDDVHLPTPRRTQSDPAEQVAHLVDPAVGGRVQLLHVQRRSLPDSHARRARGVRLAVHGVLAVEGHGKDPSRRRLTGTSRAAEEVGMGHPAVPDGVSEGSGHVVLAEHLREALGPVPPIQGLIRSGIERVVSISHRGSEYGRAASTSGGSPGRRRPLCSALRARAVENRGGWFRRTPAPERKRGPVTVASGSRGRRKGAWFRARRSGDLRHTGRSAESCCRQALTRFTVLRCAGPNRRARRQAPIPNTIA